MSEKRHDSIAGPLLRMGAHGGAVPESIEAVVEAVQANRVDGLAKTSMVHINCNVRALCTQDLHQLVTACSDMLVAAPRQSSKRAGTESMSQPQQLVDSRLLSVQRVGICNGLTNDFAEHRTA